MKSWFLKKGYPDNIIYEETKKVEFLRKGGKKPIVSKGVPFVVTTILFELS